MRLTVLRLGIICGLVVSAASVLRLRLTVLRLGIICGLVVSAASVLRLVSLVCGLLRLRLDQSASGIFLRFGIICG